MFFFYRILSIFPAVQVSWLRSDSLQILSVGYLVFTHDNRVSITNTWDLVISRLKQEDSGDYECQVVDRSQESMTPFVVRLVINKEKYQDDIPLQKDAPSQLGSKDLYSYFTIYFYLFNCKS